MSVSPWPDVDDRGRLVFAEEPARTARAEAEALRRYFARDLPERGQLRMGDVFAARVSPSGLKEAGERLLAPSAWVRRPVHDLRAPARDKAKEAFFAAVAPTLTPVQAKERYSKPCGNWSRFKRPHRRCRDRPTSNRTRPVIAPNY